MENVGSNEKTATPGQAYEAYLQIERAMKAAGINDLYDSMGNMLKDKLFEKAVTHYITGRPLTVSGLLKSLSVVITIDPNHKKYEIESDIRSLLPIVKEGGLVTHRDRNIIQWFGKRNFSFEKRISGQMYLLKKNLNHGQIIAEANRLGIYQEYELGEALMLANRILHGNRLKKSVMFYLVDKQDFLPCRLRVWCNDSGEIHSNVEKVTPNIEWEAGDTVFLKSEISATCPKFWKTLTIGGKTSSQLIEEIIHNFNLSTIAQGMLKHESFTTLLKQEDIDIALVTPRDLGFTSSPHFEVYIAALKCHPVYDICPAEVGPHARLAYPNQIKGEWIRIAMESIPGGDGRPNVFRVGCGQDGRWLRCYQHNAGDKLNLDEKWFVRIRK